MHKKGFTLIELLIVIAIIGILSTLAVAALGSARVRMRDSQRLADLGQFQNALEIYYNQHSAYPLDTNVILGSTNFACLSSVTGFGPSGCTEAILPQINPDIKAGFNYVYNGAKGSYAITAKLEGKAGDLSGAVQQTPNGLTKTTQ